MLRFETTFNRVEELKSPRRLEDGSVKWMPMRKGIADARQRAELSNQANQRYIEATTGKQIAGDNARQRAFNPV